MREPHALFQHDRPRRTAGTASGLARSASAQVNARTYVHYGGAPGPWFFSLDRYVLFARASSDPTLARIHHGSWPLRSATPTRLDSTMLEATGIPTPCSLPLLHAQASPLDVDIWRPARADDTIDPVQ